MSIYILKELHEVFTSNPELTACFGFLVGLLVGHRLELGRDKRKEFNEISHQLRSKLLEEKESPSPYSAVANKVEIDQFESVLPFWQLSCFRKAWNAYDYAKKKSIKRDPDYGSISFENHDEIIKYIDRLLRFTIKK